MTKRLFLDTNVLIDYYLRRTPFNECWTTLHAMQMFGDAELWTSAKSYTDVFYVGNKFVDGGALQDAIAASLEFLNVCSITRDDILLAATRRWADFEDCLVDVCAEKIKVDCIVTRDPKGFNLSSITVVQPGELIAYLAKKGFEYSLDTLG